MYGAAGTFLDTQAARNINPFASLRDAGAIPQHSATERCRVVSTGESAVAACPHAAACPHLRVPLPRRLLRPRVPASVYAPALDAAFGAARAAMAEVGA